MTPRISNIIVIGVAAIFVESLILADFTGDPVYLAPFVIFVSLYLIVLFVSLFSRLDRQ
ncbi:hypothetical protein [Gallaecimonas pentaromativorans]|uniref:Uncharacterized protein n=1 Tax=Gallaecimonas pentaromativorans TaxID=584787 RepID=A0A3N1PG74_9GAMM|nr:hypothetical protein [Gallaecimonas pentaromativorans]ROQ27585.1 hypothetical protein EDC28_104236 [Gallaecimonas pentaromativorans]